MHFKLGTGIQIHVTHNRGGLGGRIVLAFSAALVSSVHPSWDEAHAEVHAELDKREDSVGEHGAEKHVANLFPPESVEVSVISTSQTERNRLFRHIGIDQHEQEGRVEEEHVEGEGCNLG